MNDPSERGFSRISERGFSLIELLIATSLIGVALSLAFGATMSLVRNRSLINQRERIDTTMRNILVDLEAAASYQSLRASALPASGGTIHVVVAQWEPDRSDAPIDCALTQSATTPGVATVETLVCHTRGGIERSATTSLPFTAPMPDSYVTPTP